MVTGLRGRFLAALIFLGVVPLASVGVVLDRRGGQVLTLRAFEEIGTVAVFKSQQLRAWVRARQEDVLRPATIPVTQRRVARLLGDRAVERAEAAVELRGVLESIRSRQGFGEMFVLDARDGRVVLSTDPDQEGKFKDDRPYFREGRNAPFTQHVYYSLVLGRPVMTFAAPVRGAAGQAIAVVVGRIDLRFIDRIMAERAGLGQTGRSFLVNRFNYFVSDTLGRGPAGWRPVWSDGVRRALAGETGTTIYQNHDGERVVGSYRWLPDLGLALLVEVEHGEAMAPIWQLRLAMIGTLALAAGLAVVLSLVFAFQIGRPLAGLVSAVRSIGAGDLTHRVALTGPGEIGTLAAAVNRMADDLEASRHALEAHRETLETQVRERTAEAEARRRAAEALAEVGRRVSQSLDPGVVAQLAVESLCRLVEAKMAVLYRVDPASEDLLLAAGSGPDVDWNPRLAKGTATVGIAVRDRGPVTTPDLLEDPRISLAPEARARIERSGYRAVLAVPLLIQDRVIGALGVGASAGRVFGPEEVALAQAFADQVALAFQNATLVADLKTRGERLVALLQASRELSAIRPLDQVLTNIAAACGRLLDSDSVGFRVVEGDELVVKGTWGDAPRAMLKLRLKLGESLSGVVATTGQPLIVSDPADDPRNLPEHREALRRLGHRAWIGVPVKVGERVVGVLSVRTRREQGFTDADCATATAFAAQAAVALENARLYEEARRARDFFESIAANSGDAIVATDMQGRITYWSPGAGELFGYASEEVLGRPVAEHFRGGLGEARAVMRRVLAEGRIRDCEIGYRARDGRWVETRATASLLRDDRGTVVGTVGVAKDVTERKRAEQMLRKLSGALESTADAVFVTDRQGIIEYANPAFEQLTGYAREEVVGARPGIFKSGRHGAGFYEEIWRALLAGEVVRQVFVNRRKSGELFYEEKTITPIRDRDGAITHFVSTGRDVTDRRRGEERQAVRLAVTRVLAECKTLAEAGPRLLEAIGDRLGWDVGELWWVGEEASGLRCEASWSRRPLPAPAREPMIRGTVLALGAGLAGRLLSEEAPLWIADGAEGFEDPTAAIAVAAGLRCALAVPLRVESDVRAILVLRSGEVRSPDEDLLALAADLASQIGQFVGRELAERALHEREVEFRQAQKMEAIGRLAGGIAHDFNNLLTVINGRSQLLLKKLPPDHPVARDLALIGKTGERAAQLTRQLLAFSRKQVLRPEVLDLNVVVGEMTTMLRRVIGEDICLDLRFAPTLGWVNADPGQVEQIVMNLAVNARDAMPQGGTLTIRTADVEVDRRAVGQGGFSPGRYVLLEVADTGHGMDAETRARVFEPFFTTKGQGRGTGLGLSTVYGIVQQSAGGITVESEPGRGATFRVYLPRVDESTGPEPKPAAAPASGGTETVLLVEDEAEVRALAREALETHGYTVLEATGGEQAIGLSERHRGPIHLLLTDVVMPGMTGVETAHRIAARRRDLRVLFVSGYTDDTVFANGLLDQAAPYLEKPFTPEDLAVRVREVLDGRPGRSRSRAAKRHMVDA